MERELFCVMYNNIRGGDFITTIASTPYWWELVKRIAPYIGMPVCTTLCDWFCAILPHILRESPEIVRTCMYEGHGCFTLYTQMANICENVFHPGLRAAEYAGCLRIGESITNTGCIPGCNWICRNLNLYTQPAVPHDEL